jgi:hypothetical protein
MCSLVPCRSPDGVTSNRPGQSQSKVPVTRIDVVWSGSDQRELQSLAHIRPITASHIAKNMGGRVAKPDRHLVRLAHANGFESGAQCCGTVACFLREDIRLVDSVLWRFATLHDVIMWFGLRS